MFVVAGERARMLYVRVTYPQSPPSFAAISSWTEIEGPLLLLMWMLYNTDIFHPSSPAQHENEQQTKCIRLLWEKCIYIFGVRVEGAYNTPFDRFGDDASRVKYAID